MWSENNVKEYIRNLPDKQSGIALDIGANIGLYTLALAEKFEQVHAFEPNPANMQQLVDSAFHKPNIIFYSEAIGKSNDILINLYLNKNPGMHTINHEIAASGKYGHFEDISIPVPSITLDRFAETHKNIKFIKCDIETAEDYVFDCGKELFTTNKMTMLLEIHQTVRLQRLYDLFVSYGYKMYDLLKNPIDHFEHDEHYLISNEID